MRAEKAVLFTSAARSDLQAMRAWIAEKSSETVADRFVEGVVAHCERLSLFPVRGRSRDDLRLGLRVIGYRRRVSIAFVVEDAAVVVLAIHLKGRDDRIPQEGERGDL